MRSIASAVLITACSSLALADGQTHYAGSEDAEHAFWSELYPSGGRTLYCGKSFTAAADGLVAGAVYSIRQMRSALACTTTNQCAIKTPDYLFMIGDLHNLYPTLGWVEAARQNGQLTMVDEPRPKMLDTDGCVLKSGFKSLEPQDHAKGNVARALAYMHHEYNLPLPSPLEMLKRWHRLDPVDAAERARNDRIVSLQGTRNLFIDDPDAMDTLAGQ